MPIKVLCLMGPTASGKTALAIALHERFPVEIISVDSALVYQEMDIGTAKPTLKEREVTPQHLIDIINPLQSYSVAQFCKDAKQLIEAIHARQKIPLLVGGTMMYFNALQQGLSVLPEADPSIREHLLQQAEVEGWPALHEQLKEVDPETAARIHPHDSQRIQRALEVYASSGKPLSYFLQEAKKENQAYHFKNLALFPQDRAWLHQRIALRFEEMLKAGFVAEVEQLIKKWPLTPAHPALRCVGYRQAYDYLAGEMDYNTFCEQAIAATRQLAKRQLTWLRHWNDITYVACEENGGVDEVVRYMVNGK